MAVDLGSLFVRIGSETSGLKRGEREVDTATRRMEARIKSTTAAASKLWLAIGGTAAIYAAARAGRALVDTSIAMERIENSLRAATGSAAGAQRELGFVRAEAERLGLNLEQTAGAYASLAAAARGTALEGQAAREIFTAISEAATVMGLSAYEAEGALRAIEQMISKGSVQAEELRGQLGERLPGAFQIAARAMGVTTQELSKMLADGEVLASDLLPKLARQLREEFSGEVPNAVKGLHQEIERLNTAWFELKAAFAESVLGEKLLDSLSGLTDFLREIPNHARAGALAVNDVALAMLHLMEVHHKLPSPATGLMLLIGADEKWIEERIAKYRLLRERLLEEIDDSHLPPDFNDPIQGEGRGTGGSAATAAAAAKQKEADAVAEWIANQRTAIEALRYEMEGREHLIPVLELEAALSKDNKTLKEGERQAVEALATEYADLQKQLEANREIQAQRDREKQSIDELMESQAQQLTIMAEKLRGDEEQARWLETLYSLNLKQTKLTSEQTRIIQDNLRSIEEYKAELAEKYRIEQLAAEIIERQITAEERLANALRDVQAAQEAGLLTEVQAAQESQRLTEENRKLAAAYEDLASGISNAFAGTFEGLILGTESVSEAFRNLAVEIQKAIMQALIFEPLKAALTGGMSGMFSGAGFGAGFSQGIQAHFQPMAKGGIVDSPTIVSPTQIAGERGAEAVLPLTRTRGGALGVMADVGSDQGPPVIIQIIDQRQNGGQVERRESRGPNGERRIQLYIRDEVRRQMDQGEYDGVLRRNYGVARTGSGR